MTLWFTPPVSAAVASRGTRRSVRRDRWLGAAARVRLLRNEAINEAADKRRCSADRACDHADSWPATARLAFAPAKLDLELAPSFFLKAQKSAETTDVLARLFCPRPLTDESDGSTDMQRNQLEVRTVVFGYRAICGSGVAKWQVPLLIFSPDPVVQNCPWSSSDCGVERSARHEKSLPYGAARCSYNDTRRPIP
jgi:hypothetical protein